jgi:molybdopterin converting factor small subunit
MSDVEIHLFAAARAAVGSPVVREESGPLSEILDRLVEQYPDFAAVRPRCSFLVNEVSARDAEVVPPGARVDVLPPFAGG